MAQTNILLEKVIAALEACSFIDDPDCGKCYLDGPGFGFACRDQLRRFAIALLKADLQAQREAQAAIETVAYMEQWEPTYNPEDGSL